MQKSGWQNLNLENETEMHLQVYKAQSLDVSILADLLRSLGCFACVSTELQIHPKTNTRAFGLTISPLYLALNGVITISTTNKMMLHICCVGTTII
jgi:hypothetical protein